jgi:hypothetical protein
MQQDLWPEQQECHSIHRCLRLTVLLFCRPGYSFSAVWGDLSAGGRHITNRHQVEMHAFWQSLEWLANTILFLWVGIALGFVLLQPSVPLLSTEVRPVSADSTREDCHLPFPASRVSCPVGP